METSRGNTGLMVYVANMYKDIEKQEVDIITHVVTTLFV